METSSLRLKEHGSSLHEPLSNLIAGTSSTTISNNNNTTTSFSEVFRKAHESAFRSGLYGAAAGSVQVVSLMWLRTVINYQYRYGGTCLQAMQALYQEGGIPRFYRGMPYALIQNPLTKFGAVAANEISRILVNHHYNSYSHDTQHLPVSRSFYTSLLGTIFSMLWRWLLVPLETLKTIQQVDGAAGYALLWQELDLQGISGVIHRLYRGSVATLLSTLVSHYPWFFTYNLLDNYLPLPSPRARRGRGAGEGEEQTGLLILRLSLIGFVAALVGDCLSNLLRVLKTLRQTVQTTSTSSSLSSSGYASYFSLLQQAAQESEGGYLALAGRGLVTRVIANGLQSMVFVLVWKLVPLYLQDRRERIREGQGGYEEKQEEKMDEELR